MSQKRDGKKFVVPVLLVIGLCMVFTPVHAAAKYKAPKPIMSVCGASGGSLYVPYVAAFAKVMQENFEGLNMNVEPGGSSQNVVLVNKKEAEFGITSSSQAYMGYWGVGWVKDKQKYSDVRAIFPAYPAICAIFTKEDSPIKKFEDVGGRIFTLGYAGSGSDVMGRQMLAMFDIKPKQIVNASWDDLSGMIADGLVDAGLWIAGHPAGEIEQLEIRHKLRFIKLSDEMMNKFIEKYPYYGKTVLKKVYKGMSEPMETLSITNFMITNKDFPEDFIYNTVKAVWDNVNEIRSTHKVFETVVEDIKNVPIPFHPGAVKYYKEKGIQLPTPAGAPK